MSSRNKSNSKKSQAARANGAKSRGPVTAAGRARSSRNSVRHGLSTRGAARRPGAARAALPVASVVLPTESRKDFRALLHSYLVEFDPTGPLETELVETMATTRWRLRRLAAIETGLLGNEIEFRARSMDCDFAQIELIAEPSDRLAYAFEKLANNGPSLGFLVRYEAALNRSYDRAFKQFHALKSVRLQAARALPEPNEPKLPKSHFKNTASPRPPAPPATPAAPETCPESPQTPALPPQRATAEVPPRLNDQPLHP